MQIWRMEKLDLGLHGFRQFFQDIGGFVHPPALLVLVDFRPELAAAFQNPSTPSLMFSLGAVFQLPPLQVYINGFLPLIQNIP
jgi:hypothetical protein